MYKKNYDLAVTYFEKAIDLSRKNHFSHEEALANELMAQCYIAQNKETASRGYLLNSIELYQGWGCKFKVKLLGELYENISRLKVPQEVLLSSTDELNKNSKLDFSGAMDVETIFTATQTLAKEMNPEKLTNKIIMIMLANSGANRGALILESNETFFIEGYSSLVEESIPNILGQDIKSCQYFPAAIINYVAKTKKMLVMGSFADAKQKFNDSYFTHYSPESILCTPLIRSGKLQGIIYLENSLTRNTFTRDRIAMLEMLSVQAAISLEISRSYTAFERFVPKKFLDLLGKRRLVDIQLGDSMELTLTTLFCDLRNFTQISEQRASHETFTILNQFLSDVAPIIIKYEGFIDKYIGDAVLALFPTDKPDGAIKAAIEIQQAIQALNIRLKEQGLIEHALAAGIGINCGASVMGVLGSKERLDTTVISDAVNLASRVEALNKIYATDILVTNNVISRLVSPQSFELYQVDKVIVKGRTQAISIYEVINALPSEKKQVKQKFYNEFRQVISVYLEQDFDQAFILLNELKNKFPDEKIIDVFIEHSNLLSRSGVLENWKGAVELTSKY